MEGSPDPRTTEKGQPGTGGGEVQTGASRLVDLVCEIDQLFANND